MLCAILSASLVFAGPLEDLEARHAEKVNMVETYVPKDDQSKVLQAEERKYYVLKNMLKKPDTDLLWMISRYSETEKDIKMWVPAGAPRESALNDLWEGFKHELNAYALVHDSSELVVKGKGENVFGDWLKNSKQFARSTIINGHELASVMHDVQHEYETQLARGASPCDNEESSSSAVPSIVAISWLLSGLIMGSIVSTLAAKKLLKREDEYAVVSNYYLI